MLQNASSVDQFNASVQNANNTINTTSVAVGLLGGYFTSLSPTLFNAAKAAQANGVAFETINKGLVTAGPAVDKATQALIRLGTAPGRTVEDIANINNQLAALSVSSDQGAVQAARLANAFLNGGISANELKVALENIAASNAAIAIQFDRTSQAAALAATGGAAYNTQLAALGITQVQVNQSLNDSVDAYTQELQKQAESEAQGRLLEEVKKALVDLMPAIVNGSITEGNAAIQLAKQFGIEEAAVRGLIAAKRELASIGDGLLAGQKANTTELTKPGTARLSTGRFGSGDDAIARVIEQQKAQQKANEELKASERELAIAQGGRAAEIKILEKELAGLTTGTTEYNKTLAKLTTAREQEAKAGGGSSSPKLSAQEKLNNQLAANQDKFENNLENSEIQHQQKILDIQEEFAKKQLAAQRESEVSKRTSRADFYESLIDQDGVDQQKYSAQYEAAFAEAQKLAQEGQLKLSQELLALRQKQIQDDIAFDKKREAVKSNKDLSSKEKAARLAALDNIDRMRKEAQAEEEKQLREGGDSNLNALDESLSAEEERYNEQTGKVTKAAADAADARIANWKRANQAIAAEPPAELLTFGNVPTAQNPASAALANIPPAQVNQTTTADTTVQPPDAAMSVRIVELALVRDEGVISELQALAARLEGKLSEVNGAIAGQTGTLSGKLDSIASAVRNIKSARLVNP